MSTFRALTVAALVCGLAAGVQADTLDLTSAQAASRFDQAGKPTTGMTQASVEASFGPPASRQSPVGDPPISRWIYDDFVVYFEYDKVIHSVSKN